MKCGWWVVAWAAMTGVAWAADPVVSVESRYVDVEVCPAGEDCVVLTWEGQASNHALGAARGTLVLGLYREDGSEVSEVDIGSLRLDRMERRAVSAELEVDVETWNQVYAVEPRVEDPSVVGKIRLGSTPGTLVSDTRSSDEKAADRQVWATQMELKVQRLERDYSRKLSDYEALKAEIGPFGTTDEKTAKKLKRLAKKASAAAQALREAERQLHRAR